MLVTPSGQRTVPVQVLIWVSEDTENGFHSRSFRMKVASASDCLGLVGPETEVQRFAASDLNHWSLSPSTTAMGLETGGRNVKFNLQKGPTFVYTICKIFLFACIFCNICLISVTAARLMAQQDAWAISCLSAISLKSLEEHLGQLRPTGQISWGMRTVPVQLFS